MPDDVDLVFPTTEGEWTQAQCLIDELMDRDADQSRSLGFDRGEVLSAFYPDSIDAIRRASGTPGGEFLIAKSSGAPAACAAFQRWSSEVCELYSVYVSPVYRGSGIGSRLIDRLRHDAAAAGYRAMCLETATFMHNAHKLYRACQFEICEPYRARPPRFLEATIAMRCVLSHLAHREGHKHA
jgi:N-acetylglutamate synthase-like GNAT family acetyltransferase